MPSDQFVRGPENDEVERVVSECWRDVFCLNHVETTQDFFDLDGNSLLAKRLLGQIETRLKCKIPFRVIFDAPTVGELAAQVRKIVENSA